MAGRSLLTRYLTLVVATPANTLPAAPQSTPWPLGGVVLDAVEVVIPDGHAGFTGIAFAYDGTRLAPWDDPAAWFVGNADKVSVDFDIEVGHPLTVLTINQDVTFVHSHYLRARIHDIGDDAGLSSVAVAPVA